MLRISLYLKTHFLLAVPLLLLPINVALAQTRNIQSYINDVTLFLNNTIIPLLFSVAILFLFVNVTRYFVIESSDAYKREEAKKYSLYAVVGLVFLISIWGIVNLVTGAFGINGNVPVCPDYIQRSSGGCSTPTPSGSSNNFGFTNNPFGEFGN